MDFVNRLRAVARRIPQIRLPDLDGQVDAVHAGVQVHLARQLDGAARVLAGQGDLGGQAARRGDFHLDGQVRHLGGYVALPDVYSRDPGVIPGFEPDRTPDAAGHKARSPIPPILEGGFADVGLLFGSGLVAPLVGRSHFGGRLDRRWKQDHQRVCALLEKGLHVHAPFAKHVIRGQHELAVEIDLGVGVEPLEDQIDVAAPE